MRYDREFVPTDAPKIFRMSQGMALCSEVLNAPLSCPIPAVLQGRGASDAGGVVRLTLPR